jgi:PKD repeat protein
MDISLNNATSWSWEFPGGTPSTSNQQNPTIAYNSLGSFDVKLVVSDGVNTDSIAMTNYITVSNPGIGDPLPYFENFENGFPQNGLSIFDADGIATWMLDSVAPIEGDYCIKIDNLNNPCCGSIDEVILPYFDLTTVGSTPYMKFVWAYAKSDALYSDELIVQISVDCGNNWDQVFYRTNTALTTGPTQTTSFVPDSSQWKSASINLGAYSSEQYALLKIVNVPDGGNNLYIDDIKIGDQNVGIENEKQIGEEWTIFPNPSSDELFIDLKETTTGSFRIINGMGQILNTFYFSNKDKLNIDVNNFPNGIYQIQIITGNTMDSKSLIINK